MRYVSATVKPYSTCKTKKYLKDAAALINAGNTLTDVDVTLHDTFGPLGEVTAGIKDLLTPELEGVTLNISNDRRSWHASVSAKDGRLVVK